jgi:hypothetical protein
MIPTEHTEGTEPKHRDWNINRRARRARREFPRPFSAISACSAITVTGETRVVDVQSAKREVTLEFSF